MKRKPLFVLAALVLLAYGTAKLSEFNNDKPLVFDKNNPPNILMLSTKTCIYCKKARAFFKQQQLPYTELDIEESDKNMRMFQLLGGRGTPLIVIEGQTLHGFNKPDIRRAIENPD